MYTCSIHPKAILTLYCTGSTATYISSIHPKAPSASRSAFILTESSNHNGTSFFRLSTCMMAGEGPTW